MFKTTIALIFVTLATTGTVVAQETQDAKREETRAKLRALDWVLGPRDIKLAGNSTLSLPEGYVYLDPANTAKYEELSHNLSSGNEVMIAPKNLEWNAFLTWEDEGYVKDDEKIDAPAILKSLQAATEAANEERKRRGWDELHVVGWNINPAYNSTTKRLEWATLLRSQQNEGTNFFTKILGRRGFTSVVLVASTEDTPAAVTDLNRVLSGYHFNPGETYAEWRPGDKIAEYGLTGLILGGAAAAAIKTGLLKGAWKFLVAGIAAFWKIILGLAVAASAWLKSLFKRKQSPG